LGIGSGFGVELVEYVNISPRIASAISRGLATLIELQTVYGAEDLYKLLEIAAIDGYNREQITKAQTRGNNH
jgi:hypothetical protein